MKKFPSALGKKQVSLYKGAKSSLQATKLSFGKLQVAASEKDPNWYSNDNSQKALADANTCIKDFKTQKSNIEKSIAMVCNMV